MKTLSSRLPTRFLARSLVAALFLLPVVWMLAAALRPPGTPLPQTLDQLLAVPTSQNFARVWHLVPLGRYALNSVLVVALAVPLTLVTGSWAGFSMAQLPQASQRRLVLVALAMLMVPGVALWS